MFAVAAASVMQGVGALMKAQGESSALNYQSSIQRNNAQLAVQSAKADADKQSIISGAKIGQQVASYGASGVDLNSGSVLSVLGASAANAELDRQNILHGGTIRAINYQNQASLDESSAGNALKSGYFSAAAAGIGGALKVGSYFTGGGSNLLSSSTQTDEEALSGYDTANKTLGFGRQYDVPSASDVMGATG